MFTRIRCADIRTRVPNGTDSLVISIPIRCIHRHARLGKGVHVRVRSVAPTGGGDDVPNDGTLFIARG